MSHSPHCCDAWSRLLVAVFRQLFLLAALVTLCTAASAQASGKAPFDHLSTGFALNGAHTNARCESCHQRGQFKGTPRDCASCHTAGSAWARGNLLKGAQHVSTTQACDSCHSTRSFAGARFSHGGVAPGGCQSCHNGSSAPGKPAGHLSTRNSCDSCHSTQAWTPAASFDHTGVAPGTCISCHGPGGQGTQRPGTHIPVAGSQSCDSCHRSFTTWRPSSFNHSQVVVTAQCAGCHTGSFAPADGKPANHIPYTAIGAVGNASCDVCHKAGYASWSPARLHTSVSVNSQCATCHTGSFPPAVGKPATAIHAGATSCESCHNTSTWAGAKVDHTSYNQTTNCASCHNGSTAPGKPATHVPVGTANCFACHSVASWKPTKWNHTQVVVTAQCASCHTGAFPPADGKPATHIPYTSVAGVGNASCDACHKAGFGSWTPARFHGNYSVSTQCATCHNGSFPPAVGKPATPVHAGVSTCESCHNTSSWIGAQVDHSKYNQTTNCASCHNGSSAPGKPATHVPVGTANCYSCHGVTSWKPTKWNHTQVVVTAQCASCHTGAFPPADGKPATHIPYTSVAGVGNASCDACHKAGFGSWTPARFHGNYSVSTQCATCHNGSFPPAVGKPATPVHTGVSTCESCHNTSSWSGAQVDHSKYNQTTNCASCHNGSTAPGKPSTHIPVGVTNCYACHSVTAWKPTKWTHTQVVVTAQCASCHNGAYPPADGKPATHIPYTLIPVAGAANCDACHRSGFASWNPGRFHANFAVSNLCSTCHTGSYLGAVGKPATPVHAGVSSCEGCHNTNSWLGAKVDHSGYNQTTNCASCHNGSTAPGKPATHIPVGTTNCYACHGVTGWKPTKWNHTQVVVTAQCASCHNGGYAPADGKPTNHVPYALVTVSASANCDACHKSGYASWNPGRFHANFSTSTQCATCHTGGYLAAVGKPATPVHAGVTVCESCHRSTSSWQTVQYQHSPNNQVGSGTCDTCHNGGTAKGKPAGHIPVLVGTVKCDGCHRSQAAWSTAVTTNHALLTGQALQELSRCELCQPGARGQAHQSHPRSAVAERRGDGLQRLSFRHQHLGQHAHEPQQQHGWWGGLVQELPCHGHQLPRQHGAQVADP